MSSNICKSSKDAFVRAILGITELQTARSRHEIFESEFKDKGYQCTWREWWANRWKEQVAFYIRQGWRMIPITKRSKNPLRAAENYQSHAARGPYLKRKEANDWTQQDFNLAIVGSPSGIIWADLDSPELFREELLNGLIMRTPRGFALPLKPDMAFTPNHVTALKKRGFDFREGIMYELVPLSETCLFDSADGKRHSSDDVKNGCIEGKHHEFRVREWLDMRMPMLSFSEFMGIVQ